MQMDLNKIKQIRVKSGGWVKEIGKNHKKCWKGIMGV
jgi:hypothetical protein